MNEPTPEELKEFSERMRASLGPDALRALVALGREHLAPVHPEDDAALEALWRASQRNNEGPGDHPGPSRDPAA